MFKVSFVRAIFLLMIWGVSHPVLSASANLFVYKPSSATASSIEALFKKECPNVQATVFGRPIDFKKRIKTNEASSIISLLPVVEHQEKYDVTLRGYLEGANAVPYMFVSKDKPFDIEQVGSMTMGVIDILGPKQMKAYLKEYFGKPVKLKRVNKINDLIFLLTFNVAQAIFIPKPVYEEIVKTTEMQLHARESDFKEGLVTLALQKGIQSNVEKEVKDCVLKLSEELNGILGVEKWQ